ncbi:glutaredoxin family protein [bacterium]|nr:glutaredoxin family protein [bacterium]MBU1434681.1 glutaredoxin family protein [bacterium]MBU1502668.1 glutaredoxin family protein [bacterium]
MEKWIEVDGKDSGEVRLIAISTCGWCRKCRRFFESLDISYKYIYVDLLPPEEKDLFKQTELKPYNARMTYPTVIINDKVVIGYEEDQIKEALEL